MAWLPFQKSVQSVLSRNKIKNGHEWAHVKCLEGMRKIVPVWSIYTFLMFFTGLITEFSNLVLRFWSPPPRISSGSFSSSLTYLGNGKKLPAVISNKNANFFLQKLIFPFKMLRSLFFFIHFGKVFSRSFKIFFKNVRDLVQKLIIRFWKRSKWSVLASF